MYGLWMRVDYYGTDVLAFDNMQNRGLKEQLIGPIPGCSLKKLHPFLTVCITEWYRSNLV
jgi:hypothetical protein